MKTKKSTRFLSALLAVLMLFTMAPVTAFSEVEISSYADSPELADLKIAITAYENKMADVTKTTYSAYTNMLAAYNAYVYAKASIDSYTYGNDAGNLVTAKDNLETATTNMVAFVGKTGTATMTMGSDASAYCENLLYAENVTANCGGSTANDTDRYIYYGAAVMLYDDITTPSLPVMFNAKKTYASALDRRYYCMFPSSAKDSTSNHTLTLKENWHGNYQVNSITSFDFVTTIKKDLTNISKVYDTTTYSDGITNQTYFYYANLMQFDNESAFSGDNSITYNSLYWCLRGYTGGLLSTTISNVWIQSSNPIYVINYKPFLDALRSKSATLQSALSNIKSYDDADETSIRAFLTTMDKITGFDPNSNFKNNSNTVAQNVTNCASDISGHVTTINGLTAPTAASPNAYNDLRDALSLTTEDTGTDIKTLYRAGNEAGIFKTETWTPFAEAFVAAQTAIDSTVTSGYTNTNVGTIASNLVAAFGALEYALVIADSSALKEAIIQANKVLAHSSYLSGADVLQSVVNTGTATFTNGNIEALTTWPDNRQEEMNAITTSIYTALDNITFTNTTTLQNGIATLKAIDPTNVVDPAARLEAIRVAEAALAATLATKILPDNAASVVQAYEDACTAIAASISYAQTTYEMQTDKKITSSTGKEATVSGYNGNTVTYTYPTGTVYLKTSSDEKPFDIGNYSVYFYNSGNNSYSQMIYELGITNDGASTEGRMSYDKFSLTGFSGGVSSSETSGPMVFNGVDLTGKTVNDGLSDKNTLTYWWNKSKSSLTSTSPVAFNAPELNSSTAPTNATYTVNYTYIYAYYKTGGSTTGTVNPLTSTPMDVKVIDISSLCRQQEEANTHIVKNNRYGLQYYTNDSYTAFLAAVTQAKILTNEDAYLYNGTLDEYAAKCQAAYSDLVAKMAALTPIVYTATFNYEDANGAAAQKIVNGNYDDSLTVPSEILAFYDIGDYRYELSTWDAEIPETLTENSVFTATYTQTFIPADYSALDGVRANVWAVISAGRHDYYVPETYNAMVELYDSVSAAAYDNGAYKLGITNQTVIDGYTSSLQTAYNALYVKNQFMVTFEVYVDGDPYDKSVTPKDVRSTVKLTSSYTTGTATWKVNGVDVPNIGYEYSFIVTRDTTVVCDITTAEPTVETTKIIVQDAYGNTYAEYNVSSATSMIALLAEAEAPTAPYYKHIDWTVNDINSINIGDIPVSEVAVDGEIKLRPQYESTREDFVFDKKEKLENKEEDFLCWVLPVDDNTYRVVSYSEEYLYFTTGVGGPEAVTEANFSSYQGKLQGVTLEMIDAKVPIPSMRGIAEDDTSANGAYWDKETKQLRIISQFTDGYDDSKYEIVNCGVKLARNGSSTITTALNTTVSNQFIVYYSFSSMTAAEGARTYQVQSWVEYKDKVSGDITRTYSPVANVTFSL